MLKTYLQYYRTIIISASENTAFGGGNRDWAYVSWPPDLLPSFLSPIYFFSVSGWYQSILSEMRDFTIWWYIILCVFFSAIISVSLISRSLFTLISFLGTESMRHWCCCWTSCRFWGFYVDGLMEGWEGIGQSWGTASTTIFISAVICWVPSWAHDAVFHRSKLSFLTWIRCGGFS